MYLWLPNIQGYIANGGTTASMIRYLGNFSGALSPSLLNGRSLAIDDATTDQPRQINFDANNSNAIYTDNGLILPKSISKQSYIIYK